MRLVQVIVLCMFFAVYGESAPSPASVAQDSISVDSSAHKPCRKSIPLPHLSSYMGEGISVGFGAGIFNPTDECDCLGVWEGQLEYFYTEGISGGLEIKFFGGDLDKDAMLMYQRYRINAKFHLTRSKLDLYLSPVFGLESMSVEEFRNEWHNRDESRWLGSASSDSVFDEKDCEKMFSLEGFTIGLEAGGGYRISRLFGFTGSIMFEYNFAAAQLLSLSNGFALDLREIWPWAGRMLASSWISFEIGLQRYFDRNVTDWASAGYLGIQIGI